MSLCVVACAVSLAGCSSVPVAPPTGDPFEPEESLPPETRALGWYTDQVWNDRERAKQAEDIISGCMAFHGFEYIPELGAPADDVENLTEALELARIEGYGIVRAYRETVEPETSTVSPVNATYFESLDPAEQNAYLVALDGTQENGFEGCRSEAQLFTLDHDSRSVYQDDEFRDLIGELGSLPARISEDERMVTLEREWGACMRGAGFIEAGDRTELNRRLHTQFDSLASPDDEQLAAFEREEIAVATADVSCAIEVAWDVVAHGVEREYQERFVEEHLEELEALVTKYGL